MDKGLVSVFGGIPSDRKIKIAGRRLGYMPQVIHNELLTALIWNMGHTVESILIPGICFV